MNTKLIVWIVGILLGAIAIGVTWYVVSRPSVTPRTLQPSTSLPVSGSIRPTPLSSATSSQFAQSTTITTQDASTITTKDFIHNGVTIPDTTNVGWYLLAGNLGYCLSKPEQCQAAPSTNFNVSYNSKLESFLITLTKEPIGQARLDMEEFMIHTLGLSQAQMCSLNYYVGVTRYVNEQYTGKNLGFSFCPGATILPQ